MSSNERTSLKNDTADVSYTEESQVRPHSPYDEILRTGAVNGSAGPTVQCPTCMGVGKVPRDQEHELVALIPVSDHRLKPRRTKLYVILTVLLCMVVAGLTLFFLIPRSIEISGRNGLVIPFYINMTQSVGVIRLRNYYNVTNNNYIPVTITKLDVTATYDFKQIGQTVNTTVVTLPLRSTKLFPVTLNLTFGDEQGKYITSYCSSKTSIPHTLFVPFQAILQSTYYGHSEQALLMTYSSVRCTDAQPEISENTL